MITKSEKKSVSELSRKRIISFLSPFHELNSIAIIKLYTCDFKGEKWLYSGLDGILCYITDFNKKACYLILYDKFCYEKLFEYELYVDSHKKITECNNKFVAIEVDNGFIGILFELENECQPFIGKIRIIGSFGKQLFEGKAKKQFDPLDNNSKFVSFTQLIKNKHIKDYMKKYNEQFLENGINICRSRNIEILGPIYYDKSNIIFIFYR